MQKLKRPICLVLAIIMFTQGTLLRGEAVDDKFTQISPQNKVDGFVHGTGYGKILMRVMMFGAVPQQGVHYMPEGTDLLFAILYSGGYTETTKLSAISIRRRGVRNLIEVDLEQLMETGEPVPKLLDGDVVNVPFNWRKNYQDFLFYTTIFTTVGTLAIGIAALVR